MLVSDLSRPSANRSSVPDIRLEAEAQLQDELVRAARLHQFNRARCQVVGVLRMEVQPTLGVGQVVVSSEPDCLLKGGAVTVGVLAETKS